MFHYFIFSSNVDCNFLNTCTKPTSWGICLRFMFKLNRLMYYYFSYDLAIVYIIFILPNVIILGARGCTLWSLSSCRLPESYSDSRTSHSSSLTRTRCCWNCKNRKWKNSCFCPSRPTFSVKLSSQNTPFPCTGYGAYTVSL